MQRVHKENDEAEVEGNMIAVGRLCMKTAGRDAGKVCVVVDVLDKNFVLVDGQTRRRKVNLSHLEPLKKEVDISPKAGHQDVVKALKSAGFEVVERKPKKKTVRPMKKRAQRKA